MLVEDYAIILNLCIKLIKIQYQCTECYHILFC